MKKVLVIIAPKDFRDEEYFVPKENLEKAGCKIVTASLTAGECAGKLGGTAQADFGLTQVKVDDFAAVVFVGGGGATIYQNNQEAWRIAKEAFKGGKILAAICIAPIILAHAGVLKGRRATVWNGDGRQKKLFKELDINFINNDVVVDENIITANGPDVAEEFSQRIIEKLR